MTARWFFRKKTPRDTVREPIQGEFFSNEAIDNTTEALVREAIQNSLDNPSKLAERVVLRFVFCGGSEARSSREISVLTDGLFEHLAAQGNGLLHAVTVEDRCPFLLIEDFGTTGLTGNPESWDAEEESRNNFYSFFRAEGQSDKSGVSLGRWGVGKFVFPRSSRASTFFALTVPEGAASPLLMGRAILRSHKVRDTIFLPDGYWGVGQDENKPVLPISEPSLINRFRELFEIRRTTEPGLSVVVPWIDEEETSVEDLEKACIRDYFFPILQGRLEVQIEANGRKSHLTSGTLQSAAAASAGDSKVIALAEWSLKTEQPAVELERHASDSAPKWTAEVMPLEAARAIVSNLDAGNRVAVRIPVIVRKKDVEPRTSEWSHFDVYLAPDTDGASHPAAFVRNGILISGASSRRVQGLRALVVANDEPIAKLLGDSENPSHTEWKKDTRGFTDRYTHAKQTLDFVKDSVREILALARSFDREPDRLLLADLFPEDANGRDVRGQRRRRSVTPDVSSVPDVPVKGGAPARYRLYKAEAGFRLAEGDAEADVPERLNVQMAYRVRRGNALKKYDPADFDVARRPIVIKCDGGASVLAASRNAIDIAVTARPFSVSVTGFDRNRDLFVRTDAE